MSILIKDTTREERERIVAESIGNIDSACDGCSPGLAEMYQDYIDGKKELTQKEVAQKMGISQSYISRLEKRIMLRLRKEFLRQTNCA